MFIVLLGPTDPLERFIPIYANQHRMREMRFIFLFELACGAVAEQCCKVAIKFFAYVLLDVEIDVVRC